MCSNTSQNQKDRIFAQDLYFLPGVCFVFFFLRSRSKKDFFHAISFLEEKKKKGLCFVTSQLLTMACSLKCGISVSVSVSGINETFSSSKDRSIVGVCSSLAPSPPQIRVLTSKSNSKILPALSIRFKGQSLVVSDHKSLTPWRRKALNKFSINVSVAIFFFLHFFIL